MAPSALAQVLRPIAELFPSERYPQLLVGLAEGDDAAVYRLNEGIALIFTLDFFPPVVDDPYDYGAIAAANALSDIYAMGGEVLMALNIAAFPAELDPAIIGQILRGGAEKVAEAGGILAGGHTICDREPKYGLAVVGLVHPEKVRAKKGAKPGDAVILTKPLGTGLITTALKGEVAEAPHVAEAVASMKRLNRTASQLLQKIDLHACTDITGFGLLGHSIELSQKSGVRLRFWAERLPLLPGAKDYAEAQLFPGGACRNRDYYIPQVKFAPSLPEELQMLLFTPETSGGLLAAIPKDELEGLFALFAKLEQPIWAIGEVLEGEGIEVAP